MSFPVKVANNAILMMFAGLNNQKLENIKNHKKFTFVLQVSNPLCRNENDKLI